MDSVGYIVIAAGLAVLFIAYKFFTKKDTLPEVKPLAKEKSV